MPITRPRPIVLAGPGLNSSSRSSNIQAGVSLKGILSILDFFEERKLAEQETGRDTQVGDIMKALIGGRTNQPSGGAEGLKKLLSSVQGGPTGAVNNFVQSPIEPTAGVQQRPRPPRSPFSGEGGFLPDGTFISANRDNPSILPGSQGGGIDPNLNIGLPRNTAPQTTAIPRPPSFGRSLLDAAEQVLPENRIGEPPAGAKKIDLRAISRLQTLQGADSGLIGNFLRSTPTGQKAFAKELGLGEDDFPERLRKEAALTTTREQARAKVKQQFAKTIETKVDEKIKLERAGALARENVKAQGPRTLTAKTSETFIGLGLDPLNKNDQTDINIKAAHDLQDAREAGKKRKVITLATGVFLINPSNNGRVIKRLGDKADNRKFTRLQIAYEAFRAEALKQVDGSTPFKLPENVEDAGTDITAAFDAFLLERQDSTMIKLFKLMNAQPTRVDDNLERTR